MKELCESSSSRFRTGGLKHECLQASTSSFGQRLMSAKWDVVMLDMPQFIAQGVTLNHRC